MVLRDFHVHTTYCDGKNSPEEMVCAAIEKGLDVIGFSGHSFTSCDDSYCMTREGTERYKEEIRVLRKKYADRIRILCGIEQDYYADDKPEGFDYVIGSVHYIRFGEFYLPVDHNRQTLLDAADKYCNGDMIALAEKYFALVADVVNRTDCTFIGHFDLITKFNEDSAFFDETDERYVRAWKAAADALLKTGRPFEINTGAISRGYRKTPYPNEAPLAYIRANGGRTFLCGDSHACDTLCYRFEEFADRATMDSYIPSYTDF